MIESFNYGFNSLRADNIHWFCIGTTCPALKHHLTQISNMIGMKMGKQNRIHLAYVKTHQPNIPGRTRPSIYDI